MLLNYENEITKQLYVYWMIMSNEEYSNSPHIRTYKVKIFILNPLHVRTYLG